MTALDKAGRIHDKLQTDYTAAQWFSGFLPQKLLLFYGFSYRTDQIPEQYSYYKKVQHNSGLTETYNMLKAPLVLGFLGRREGLWSAPSVPFYIYVILHLQGISVYNRQRTGNMREKLVVGSCQT